MVAHVKILFYFIFILFKFHILQLMKPAYRGRKPPVQSLKPENAKLPPIQSKSKFEPSTTLEPSSKVPSRNMNTPSRFPPNRVILRNSKRKDIGEIPKMLSHDHLHTQNQGEEDSEDLIEETGRSRVFRIDEKTLQQNLEARDRKTLLNYEFRTRKFNLEKERVKLAEWLGQMHFRVVSTSFNLYLTNSLTFEEVKVHCCQNLLLNILNFLEKLTSKPTNPSNTTSMAFMGATSKFPKTIMEPLSHLELTQILKEINATIVKNLAYMQIKYPLTKDTKPNKALKNLIFKINNLGNDEHDMVMKSGVDFKLKNEANYTPQIMKFLNFLITKQVEPCNVKGKSNKQLTYFEFFYETMETIFTSIYKPEYDNRDGKDSPRKSKVDPAVNLFADIMINRQVDEKEDQVMTKEAKQYKEKVMKYTHFLIGRKISPSTELYSAKEIQAEIFDVRNSSILRLLTKWTGELQKKIKQCQEQILKRPFRFKKDKPYEYSKLNATQKNDLYQQTKRRVKDVNHYTMQLRQNYNEIESMISSHLDQSAETQNIPKKQYKVGYFCSKIQVSASSTLLEYLNKMIHLLLMIPVELKKTHDHDEEYLENLDINLITFKISDLFRCKIKSREAEIIRIFKEIKQISEKGEPFKIVRIKDRLNLGTRDILVNILFMNTFLCEIQLAVEEYVDSKQVTYDSFSHYLYELHRSRLGPIMESACTWAQFDQRSKIFRNLTVEKQSNEVSSLVLHKFIQHSCSSEFLKSNNYPFICSICERFYSSQQGLLHHRRCVLCKTYFQCANCIYSKMTDTQVAELVNLPEKLGIFINDFQLWEFSLQNFYMPKFGILTSRKLKRPNLIFFQTIIYRSDSYIVQIQEDKDSKDLIKINIIEKIIAGKKVAWKKISEKYIIYEWTEKRAFNLTITPEQMLRAVEEEKNLEKKKANQRKQQKQKKRLQLQMKRKDRYGESDEEDDKKDEDKKQGKEGKQGKQGKLGKDEKGEKKGKKKRHRDQDDFEIYPEQKKDQKIEIYHQTISKRNQRTKVRVIKRQTETSRQIFVLGIYLKESTIRNRLKEMSNSQILKRISFEKIEVLFVEDEYIQNELNDTSNMNENEKGQLKQTLQRVSQVYLDNNYIKDISFLSKMTSLKVAHLSHNYITHLTYIQDLTLLTQLVVQNNNIRNLNGLENKPELLEVSLNRNEIQDLEFFKMVSKEEFSRLRNLLLSGNQIRSIEGLENLSNLVKLDLSYNRIEIIAKIGDMPSIEQLDLSSNKLTKIERIKQFKNLKKLFLNDNKILKIPSSIKQLVRLQVLQMSENSLSQIQHLEKAKFVRTIKVLNLSDNKIRKMEGLSGMENLQILDLSNNEISIINDYLDLSSLVKLDLSHNSLSDIDANHEDVEKYMPSLKELYINSNNLEDNVETKMMIEKMKKTLKVVKYTLNPDTNELFGSEEKMKRKKSDPSVFSQQRSLKSKRMMSFS